jgi:pimeloyl-ACP methyl ester carboxylesterase
MLRTFPGFAVALFLASLPVLADDFDSAGVKIHYMVQGAGEPVIVIHGLYADAQKNWGLPGVIGDLSQHYQVVALDCRGHGQSDKPAAEGDYGIKMVDDVVRLMDHLHLPSANIIGYSMGGMIALKLAVTHPDRVHSVILGGMGWMQQGSPLQRVWENMGERGGGRGNPALLHGFADFAVTADQVKTLKMPIQVVVGERDPCRRMYVEPLLGIRPDIAEHVVPNAGHLLCILKPEFKADLNAALSRNLAAR